MFFLFYILNQVPSHFSCVGECCNAVLLWSSLCGQNCKLACRQTVVLALKNTLIPKPYICPVIYSKRNPPISDVKPLCRGYLSDGHGAEDVEEDKGAVCKILAQQVAVGQPLDVGQRHKRQLGHYSSVKAEQKWDNSVRANIHTNTFVLLFIVCCVLCLGVPAQAAAPATRPRISGRKWMDGWMDGCFLFSFVDRKLKLTFVLSLTDISTQVIFHVVWLFNEKVNLHGVEHAHQSCKAEADGKHGLHAHLQTNRIKHEIRLHLTHTVEHHSTFSY